jgi:ribosomal protein S18 acetylase RimI-like enzyme
MGTTETRACVRPLLATDLAAVAACIDSTGLFPSELLEGMVAPYLAGCAEDQWLVYEDGAARGVCYSVPERMTAGTWNMLLLAVHADRQGSGVGRELVRAAERHVMEREGRLVLVETSGLPEFERTRAFYLACGYEQEARIRDFYRAGEDKIVFRRLLRS